MKTTVKICLTSIVCAAMLCLGFVSAQAADRMYFSGFNQETDGRSVLLVWGELEGNIPETISEFRIYRKIADKEFHPEPLAVIPNALLSSAALGEFFNASGEGAAKEAMVALLDDMIQDTTIDGDNYLEYLYNIIDPGHEDFSRFKQLHLSRFSKHVARTLGRAYVDTDPGDETNTYLMTAVVEGKESKPLGKTVIPVGSETILPAPANFRSVEIGGCSEINRYMDHVKIHFNWDVPSSPQDMGLSTLIYGYDIYRSTSDLGTLDLRQSLATGLTRITPVPVVASGNTASDGADAFLASDGGRAALSGELDEGAILYYYLVARDLSGRYSHTQGPIKVQVPDREAPVMPFNVHTRQEMDEATPRMTLIWDRTNQDNYQAFYTRDKAYCPTSPAGKVCYTKPSGNCAADDKECSDIDVDHYRVFRFASFQEARNWGTDSDGDGWPDEKEEAYGSDPCDDASVPSGQPNPLIATIDADTQIRTLPESGKEVHYFRDSTPAPDNKVYWYRIAAIDKAKNVSPLTPPMRAALWDRTQPVVDAELRTQRCSYSVKRPTNNDDCIEKPQDDAVLYVIDATPNTDARRFQLFERCVTGQHGTQFNLLYASDIKGTAAITRADLVNYTCGTCGDDGKVSGYIIRFFGENGGFLAESDALDGVNCLEEFSGCAILQQDCVTVTHTPDDPTIFPVDPLTPVNVCVNLSQNQCARVYRKINDTMTPIASWCFDDGPCSPNLDLRGIVTADVCLGVRVFSENGVGSPMTYFNCIPVMTPSAPKAPLMEGVTPTGEVDAPTFEVRWSAQREGIAAFIVRYESKSGIFYETLWDLVPDETTGQFSATVAIEADAIENEWCFDVRAMDTTLTLSDWSDKRCSVWGEAAEGVSLTWPHVKTPADAGNIVVVRSPNQAAPMLILSDALGDRLTAFANQCPEKQNEKQCSVNDYYVPPCGDGETNCLVPSAFCCDICGVIRSWNKLGTFMVYRQEEGKDFIQISPLVETIHCTYDAEIPAESTVNDPLIHMVSFDGSMSADNSSANDADIIGGINNSIRLVFGDWFPYTSGKRVRYKVLSFGAQSKEPEKVYTSGWLTLP